MTTDYHHHVLCTFSNSNSKRKYPVSDVGIELVYDLAFQDAKEDVCEIFLILKNDCVFDNSGYLMSRSIKEQSGMDRT